MSIETIDHVTLIQLTEAGVVRSARAVGRDGGWGVLVQYGTTERALATQRRNQVRVFRKLETLVAYLKKVGIPRFDVDALNYDPNHIAGVKRRPDRAAAMKDAHEATAYARWLEAEIQEAIDDPSPVIPHDEAMRRKRPAAPPSNFQLI